MPEFKRPIDRVKYFVQAEIDILRKVADTVKSRVKTGTPIIIKPSQDIAISPEFTGDMREDRNRIRRAVIGLPVDKDYQFHKPPR